MCNRIVRGANNVYLRMDYGIHDKKRRWRRGHKDIGACVVHGRTI
jgi:hypothetical protein